MNDDKIKNPSTNAVARMDVTLKPIEEPASPIPNIVLATCLHGEHRRDHGPNTFAAGLVRAGLVSRYSCKCEWCELGRRVPGIGCDPEEQHQPEDSMRFWLRVVRTTSTARSSASGAGARCRTCAMTSTVCSRGGSRRAR